MKKLKFTILNLFLLLVLIQPLTVNASEFSGFIDTNNETGEGRILTFDQMIAEIAQDQGVSISEVKGFYVDETKNDLKSNSKFKNIKSNELLVESLAISILSTTYYYTDTFPMGSLTVGSTTYYPRATIYYSYTGTSSSRSIVKVLYASIIGTDKNGLYKAFGGDFYINVETAGKIHYIVNGSYYNTGTFTSGVNLSIPVGGYATVGFTASNTTNFFKGIYYTGDRYSMPR